MPVLITCDTCHCLRRHDKSGLAQIMSYSWVERGSSEPPVPAGEITVELWRCQKCGAERAYGMAPGYQQASAD